MQQKLSRRREAALRAFARRLKADAEAQAEAALAAWEERTLACVTWDEDEEDPALGRASDGRGRCLA